MGKVAFFLDAPIDCVWAGRGPHLAGAGRRPGHPGVGGPSPGRGARGGAGRTALTLPRPPAGSGSGPGEGKSGCGADGEEGRPGSGEAWGPPDPQPCQRGEPGGGGEGHLAPTPDGWGSVALPQGKTRALARTACRPPELQPRSSVGGGTPRPAMPSCHHDADPSHLASPPQPQPSLPRTQEPPPPPSPGRLCGGQAPRLGRRSGHFARCTPRRVPPEARAAPHRPPQLTVRGARAPGGCHGAGAAGAGGWPCDAAAVAPAHASGRGANLRNRSGGTSRPLLRAVALKRRQLVLLKSLNLVPKLKWANGAHRSQARTNRRAVGGDALVHAQLEAGPSSEAQPPPISPAPGGRKDAEDRGRGLRGQGQRGRGARGPAARGEILPRMRVSSALPSAVSGTGLPQVLIPS
jgi:hypothetical protein